MGCIYAILAALCNSSIGIFSKFGFKSNIDNITLAFYRCFFAFIFLTIFFLIKKDGYKEIIKLNKFTFKILLVSFFGVFILYYFEIWSLKLAPIPVVSFLLFASGIVSIILGCFWLKESINIYKILSIIFVFTGVFFIFNSLSIGNINIMGAILSIIAGLGYSTFLVLARKFKIPGTFSTLWYLFGFGSIYLFIPFAINGIKIPDINSIPTILALSFIPTICGFYFTNKALSLTEAGRVQAFEMSEPVFASIFAFIFFREILPIRGIFGSFLIILGLIILQFGNIIINYVKKIFIIKKDLAHVSKNSDPPIDEHTP